MPQRTVIKNRVQIGFGRFGWDGLGLGDLLRVAIESRGMSTRHFKNWAWVLLLLVGAILTASLATTTHLVVCLVGLALALILSVCVTSWERTANHKLHFFLLNGALMLGPGLAYILISSKM